MKALKLVKQNFRGYILLNVMFYGLVAVSMVYVFIFPDIQEDLMESVRTEFLELFPFVVEAYMSANFPLAAGLTFSLNLILGSLVYITLLSLIIPFGGIVMGCVRAVGWGLLLAPTSPELAWTMVPHSLTLILEGQGYILAMFATYIHWKGVIRPKSIGEERRLKAYFTGIKKTANIYVLVAIVLAIAAIYEAFEVIYIVGRFR